MSVWPLTGAAQTSAPVTEKIPSTEHQWTYGVGHVNVLDTYLSPLTYEGPAFSVHHRSERLARWGKGRVTVQGDFGGRAAYTATAPDDDKAWDGDFKAGVAWLYNWHPTAGLRIAAGGRADLGLGFTYLLKSSNNPAQGRLHIEAGISALAEQQFHLWHKPFAARVQLDLPMIGAMFTPNYGQSYYEIFALGNYDKNIRCTHPFNAPSGQLETTLRMPLGKSALTLGYRGDIRQSHVNHLKHHAWTHSFIIGYVRRLHLLPHPLQ